MKRLLLVLVLGAWGTLEDFTTYTEVDPGNDIAVIANKITWTNLDSRNSSSHVYKDFGVDHFNGDFAHRLKSEITVADSDVSVGVFWMLANSVNDLNAVVGASEDAHAVYVYEVGPGSYDFRLAIVEDGVFEVIESQAINLSTTYFSTIERDDDGGANNTGQLTLRIYTTNYYGEAGAVEVATLTGDSSAGEQNDFRYVYATNTLNSGLAGRLLDGTVEDLDLGEEAAAAGGQVIMIE